MAHQTIRGTVTIASGQTASGDINLTPGVTYLGLLAPGTLPETVNLQVAEALGGTFRILRSEGTDVAITAARAIGVVLAPFSVFRLLATGAVAADRTFDYIAFLS